MDDALETGSLHLLFVSPESWTRVFDHWPRLQKEVAQIVVDEAHLINSWGQDFRFDYQNLGKLRREFPGVPVLALTATATTQGCEKIIKQLGLKEGLEVQKLPIRRPHLFLSRKATGGDFESKYAALMEFIEPRKALPGIVYCPTRKDANKLAERLKEKLFAEELQLEGHEQERKEAIETRVRMYHAGINRKERDSAQNAFMKGDCTLMVATVAFGMGVNKKNIRFVVHFGSPPTLENYVQEVGRAGRDAFRAECMLIHSSADWVTWRERLGSEEKKAKDDEGPKGKWKKASRLRRISDRQSELDQMENFVRGSHCLHRRIEDRFFDENFDKEMPKDCVRSCDHCLLQR